MPVRASAPFRRRPVDAVADDADDRRRQRQRQPRQQQPGRQVLAAEHPGQRRGGEREVDQQRVADPRPRLVPSRTASVFLPARRSVSRSRDVVDHQDRGRQQADRHRQHERLPGELLALGEERAGHRDEAEEQEDEHLAEPLVAVRARAAGVEHAGEDRGDADQQQLPARR